MQAASSDGIDPLPIVLAYARHGFKVLPLQSAPGGKCSCGKPACESAGKHPRLPNGAHGSSSDEATIQGWFKRWPDTNWGMTLENLVVVDIDPRHSGDATFDALIAAHGELPETPKQATGGGGWHYLMRSTTGAHYKGGMGAGIDLKHGAGQFIVVEPSVHASGNRYYWLDEEGPHEGGKIAQAPGWIAGNVQPTRDNVHAGPGADKIGAGGRNAFLYERCRRFRDMAMTQEEIEATALTLNRTRCVPPLSDDEVHTIAKSAALNEPEVKKSAQFVPGSEFISDIAPPQWLVDGIIQRSYLYGLTAQTNHGKTALAAHLAICVAMQRDFAFQPCEQGHVLYLAGENPEDFKLRLRAAAQVAGLKPSALDHVTVMPTTGRLSGFIEQILEFAENTPLALIIIDTSVAYFSYMDENGNVDAKMHAQDMRLLIQATGAPAIIALCHPIKNAGKDDLTPRGGSAFLFEIDCNLTLWKEGEIMELNHNKLRGPPFQPTQFKLTTCVLTGVHDSKGREVSTVVSEHINEAAADLATQQHFSDAGSVLRAIHTLSKPSVSGIAAFCQWSLKDGRPYKSKVQRILKILTNEKFIITKLGSLQLTEKGKREIA